MSDSAWNVYSNSQIPLLRSHMVLQSALRTPAIAALPIVKAQKSPVTWLQNKLVIAFYPDTDILFVEMRVKPEEADQARQLVNEVVDAYINEIVHADRQRLLNSRDRLAKGVERLNVEVKQKMEEYYNIARELGAAEDGGQLEQQITMRRLDRAETELMRLEDELAKAKTSETSDKPGWTHLEAYYKQRIQQLSARVDELVKSLRARSEISVDLVTRKAEVDQLQKIAADMSRKLEMTDIASGAPEQETIRVIQRAVVTNGETAESDGPEAKRQ